MKAKRRLKKQKSQMRTETLDEYLKRGGSIKKDCFKISFDKIVWGKSKYDYINAYKIKKQLKLKKLTHKV